MHEQLAAAIGERFSCRRYRQAPIAGDTLAGLRAFLAANTAGPFATPVRFALTAAAEDDRRALKGLGTYGFIHHPAGFIIGAVQRGPKDMEDFGYLMEQAILFATVAGLGTCWLGGMFTKSSFAARAEASPEETVPAVASVGYIADDSKAKDWMRRRAGSDNRLPPEQLFFAYRFGRPLAPKEAVYYAEPLAAVRAAPSASNKQPWRLIYDNDRWHFYLQRTKGYGKGSLVYRLLGLADLQRVDIGIAMCHFELTARARGLSGSWLTDAPPAALPEGAEYIASWQPS